MSVIILNIPMDPDFNYQTVVASGCCKKKHRHDTSAPYVNACHPQQQPVTNYVYQQQPQFMPQPQYSFPPQIQQPYMPYPVQMPMPYYSSHGCGHHHHHHGCCSHRRPRSYYEDYYDGYVGLPPPLYRSRRRKRRRRDNDAVQVVLDTHVNADELKLPAEQAGIFTGCDRINVETMKEKAEKKGGNEKGGHGHGGHGGHGKHGHGKKGHGKHGHGKHGHGHGGHEKKDDGKSTTANKHVTEILSVEGLDTCADTLNHLTRITTYDEDDGKGKSKKGGHGKHGHGKKGHGKHGHGKKSHGLFGKKSKGHHHPSHGPYRLDEESSEDTSHSLNIFKSKSLYKSFSSQRTSLESFTWKDKINKKISLPKPVGNDVKLADNLLTRNIFKVSKERLLYTDEDKVVFDDLITDKQKNKNRAKHVFANTKPDQTFKNMSSSLKEKVISIKNTDCYNSVNKKKEDTGHSDKIMFSNSKRSNLQKLSQGAQTSVLDLAKKLQKLTWKNDKENSKNKSIQEVISRDIILLKNQLKSKK